MKEGLIGVIVPVYKVEKYIAECIESILAQTYTNFRLILVNDGTPDNAGNICDEYAKKDSRITVIHQENAGVTRARARGVEEADDCEFITFVDGDDKLHPNALEEFHIMMDDSTDIVMCTSYSTDTENYIAIDTYDDSIRINTSTFVKKLIGIKGGMPWGKLFRKRLFNEKTFNVPREIVFGEDILMNIRLAFRSAKDIKTILNPLYFYRQHSESVCSNFQHTAEYEEIYRIHLLDSIPKNRINEFSHEYIQIRLFFWRVSGGNKLPKPKWSNTTFHTQLKSDIKKYSFKIEYFEKLLLYNTNVIMRALIIFCRKIHSIYTITKKQKSCYLTQKQ